jgi:hypothetical protein
MGVGFLRCDCSELLRLSTLLALHGRLLPSSDIQNLSNAFHIHHPLHACRLLTRCFGSTRGAVTFSVNEAVSFR